MRLNVRKHLLCHFILLFLPLAGLQVEESIDLLFFCLGIVEFEDVIIDGLSSPGHRSARRGLIRANAGIDRHFSGHITRSATLARTRSGQSTCDH